MTTTPPAAAPATPATVAPAGAGPITMMAIGLWVIVGSLLAYGVVMTAIKATALFTG